MVPRYYVLINVFTCQQSAELCVLLTNKQMQSTKVMFTPLFSAIKSDLKIQCSISEMMIYKFWKLPFRAKGFCIIICAEKKIKLPDIVK